jgi:hypothetical protein
MSEEYEFNECLKEIGTCVLRKQEEGKETEGFNIWIETEDGSSFEFPSPKTLPLIEETINSIRAIPLKELRIVRKPGTNYYALIGLGDKTREFLKFPD